tara:strand:+ start:1650 stop:5513 length:3864 start_codon:yes stop_codon:yes gene_type:complete
LDILKWLNELGLSRYSDTLSEFPIEDIIEFTDDDFKELGVLTPHRKKLLVAIENLNITSPSKNNTSSRNTETASSSFSNFIKDLPQVIAIPLHEYAEEDHPGMKLWAACDAVELLLKFLVIIGAADRRQHGELDDKLLKELWGKIEMPTLGAWLSMAISLSQSKIKNDLMVPEIDKYVNTTLKTLLYGPDNPGTADTSFLKLRNRLAHGGGLTRKEAERLMSIWKDPFEKTIEALDWLRDIKIIGLDNNVPMELKGTSGNLKAGDNLDISQFKGDSDGVWLIKGGNTLSLWPMALFGYPSVSNVKGNVETGDINSTQIYVRKDVVQLQFTPLGAEGFSHSEAGVSAVEAFQSLFSLKRANQKASEKAFKIQDFGREIQKDANQMVGRFEEQEHIENSFKDIEQGIVWITGPAGIGKSFLVARLAQYLIDNNKDENKIILPYRFKSGDDARCSRDALATFTIERLVAVGALIDNAKIEEKGKAEDRLKACLDYLNKDKKVVFVLDGLDELLSKDTTFAEDIPLGLDSMRVTWVCSGRPEPELEKVFSNPRVINPYPNGLPAMQIQDIRSMLLERIGLFRNKLLAGDKEKGDEVVNPFIDLVAKRAEGLPLFVNYVTQDVQQGNYPLDGTANLPKGLTAYHEKLIEGLGVGALKELLTPLVATLAMANEPLAEQEIITFLRLRDRIPDGEAGDKLVTKGLAAIASMLRRAPDPEGEDGYMLHHLSLREHILTTETMSYPVEQARKAFAKAAMSPDEEASISNYLYRTGIDHLLSNNQVDDARSKLLDLDYLDKMFELDKQGLDILQYWLKIGDDDQGQGYKESVNKYLEKDLGEDDLDILLAFLNLCHDCGWNSVASNFTKKITEIFTQIKGKQHEDTLHSLNWHAIFLDNPNEAEIIYREILKIQKNKIHGKDSEDVSATLNLLGLCLINQDKYEDAKKVLTECLELRERLHGKDHSYVFTAINNLSIVYQELKEYKEAEFLIRRALEGRKKINGLDDPQTYTCMLNLALISEKQDKSNEAEELYSKVLEGRKKILGTSHPSYLHCLKLYAYFMFEIGKNEEGLPYLKELVELREKYLGINHPDTITSLENLAFIFYDLGKFDESEQMYRKLLNIIKKVYGKQNEKTLEILIELIDVLEDKEDFTEVELVYSEVLNIIDNVHGKEHEETLRMKQNYAVFLRNHTNEIKKAITLLEEVLFIHRKNNNPKDLSSVLTALGTTCLKAEFFDMADSALKESVDIRRNLLANGDEDILRSLISSLKRLEDVYQKTDKKDELEKIKLEIKKLSA